MKGSVLFFISFSLLLLSNTGLSAQELSDSFWEQGPQPYRFIRDMDSKLIDYALTEEIQGENRRVWIVYQALMQFHTQLLSYDYFQQFRYGDYIFEDYLTTISGMEIVSK